MSEYRLDDQRDKLGEPPWSGEPVVAWEAAHGHDCRLPCYPEHGCLIIDQEREHLVAEVDRLKQGIREHMRATKADYAESVWVRLTKNDVRLWALAGFDDDTEPGR